MKPCLLVWICATLLILSLHVLILPTVHAQQCSSYYYDHVPEDPCPFPLDGVCDVPDVCPRGSDCIDCDPCQQYNLDCRGCVSEGCVWCPRDALCLSHAVGGQNGGTLQLSCREETDWMTTCELIPLHQVFIDPLYSAQQWAYQLLNVERVWRDGITGTGVVVRVNDPDGVAVDHAEFAGKFRSDASCDQFLPPARDRSHGTAVASLAVGRANNGLCAVGMAPGASLSACVGPTQWTDRNAAAFFQNGLSTTHISVNSWGFDACKRITTTEGGGGRELQQSCPFVNTQVQENPCIVCGDDWRDASCEDVIVTYCTKHYEADYAACAEFLDLYIQCGYNALSDVGQAALTQGVQQGRNGNGIIYVFASGNEHDIYEDVNMEGWLNSRFTIVVGAVGKDGTHASYSTTGAALFISGPGGDFESISNNIVASPDGGCVDATVGTSFATPSVAGAIALVLEVNPNLGWRDVQGILASTAQQVDRNNPTWTTNGAGMHHSNLYGFGVMDTYAAVQAAKTWNNFGVEKQILAESGIVNVAIADNQANPSYSTIMVNETDSFMTESVVVYLQLDHESRGDLEVVLTSPRGTESVLSPPNRPENQHLMGEERWKLMTVRNYGENPNGEWTLTLTDHSPGNLGECADLAFVLNLELDDGSPGIANCASLEAGQVCLDGAVLNNRVDELRDETNGRTGRDACCVCGGGVPASDVNALISWRLVVYGNGDGGANIEKAEPVADVTNDNGSSGGDSWSSSASTSIRATSFMWFILGLGTLFALVGT